MGDLVQVRLCGFGGQGIVLAGTILGFAAIHDGKWVCGSNSYGAQARGGYARSEVVLSSGPVKFPLVIEPDILIALSQESYGEYVKDLSGTGALVIYDDTGVTARPMDNLKQIGVPATECAVRECKSKQVVNMVMLGASVALTGVVSKGAVVFSISENIPEQYQRLNLDAFELGYGLGEARKEEM